MGVIATRRPWVPLSERDRREVKAALELILGSPMFSGSRRYPALLRYVVEKTLSGESEDLKERTLGIEVFHRIADYDTNADPVVRFSAGEVRRRLAQYYQEIGSQTSIEISLPTGTYIPQFSREESEENSSAHGPQRAAAVSGGFSGEQLPSSAQLDAPPRNESKPSRGSLRKSFLLGVFAGMCIIGVATLNWWLFPHESSQASVKSPISELWGPILARPDEVLIAAGRTHFGDEGGPEPRDATIEQHILRPEARISFPAVKAITEVAGFLETQHRQFRIREATLLSLQDMHGLPVVLVSGYNNIWTVRLLRKFRFHLEQTGSLHYIVDEQHPDRRDFVVDFNTPYLQETTDYAIVGRFYDDTTNGPVIVIAGIGSNGSEAAGEFMVSPESLKTLARSSPDGTLNKNFAAVLKVEVIGGNTGAATIVASQFW